MLHGATASSSRSAGSRMTSLFSREPRAISHDNWDLASSWQATDVFRRHRGIVDDDACRLAAGLSRMRCNIVELTSCQLRDGRDVIEKCEQTTHFLSSSLEGHGSNERSI